MKTWTRGAHGVLASVLCSALAGCGSMSVSDPAPLMLYDGRPHAALHVQVTGWQDAQDMSGASVTGLKPANPTDAASKVSARRSAKDASDDALTMTWNNAWSAGLRLVADKPLDLRPYLGDGTLEFDIDAVDMAKSGLSFAMGCEPDCGRSVGYELPSRAMHGKGWQHLSFSLQCFVRDGNDFSRITQPFVVDSSGTGELAVANVKLVRHGKPNASCPDYRTESVTPAPQSATWAVDWWMPRHEKKLEELRKLKAAGLNPDLVFIGDSITHGWEDGGAAVWKQHYAKYHALDLGFSGDRTEHVLWRLQHGEVDAIQPKVAVLMIGTNNTGHRQEDPATIAAGIQRIIEELQRRLPQTKVLLLAIFPRDEQPTSRLRQLNERVNGIISGFADGRRVFFLNINAALTNADGTLSKDVMPDLLHPNEKGYGLWAQSMEPSLKKLLSE